ncbi:MAG: single-stranded DNA-binding protein, partial [Oscillospiraceae bacterium]
WGRNAKFAENLSVGANIKIWGRIQSREYQKRISDDEFETKTAYEISISKLENN